MNTFLKTFSIFALAIPFYIGAMNQVDPNPKELAACPKLLLTNLPSDVLCNHILANTGDSLENTTQTIRALVITNKELNKMLTNETNTKVLLSMLSNRFSKLILPCALALKTKGSAQWIANILAHHDHDEIFSKELIPEFCNAAYYNDVNSVSFFLYYFPGIVNKESNYGTALYRAIENSFIQRKKPYNTVALLLKHGASLNQIMRSEYLEGMTALSQAVHDFEAETVKLLLDEGADMRLCSNHFPDALALAEHTNRSSSVGWSKPNDVKKVLELLKKAKNRQEKSYCSIQ